MRTQKETKAHGANTAGPRATQQGKVETWTRTQSPAVAQACVSQLDMAESLHPDVHICQPLCDETMAGSRAKDSKTSSRTALKPPQGWAGSHRLGLSLGQRGYPSAGPGHCIPKVTPHPCYPSPPGWEIGGWLGGDPPKHYLSESKLLSGPPPE